ncbi:kinesin-like protein KIN-7C, mitochondrial isoform X3 [Daucus carota subsp. sativus]|uniref:kinesin-like protein KIN-7C, mitochondrial isoform X3 n=1 Tax=Daucus carota subsp. sativus TaxID=79200 RepID=UPI0007EF34C0|nr:PREDICTED: kinesin-like protein KIN-7C, mitochondrial isoform X2 [Daucus carota subsp. sativus]
MRTVKLLCEAGIIHGLHMAYAYGTIFAYGVTSSGKTHNMHGDQRSPGIIPLAVKDTFSIIQETPSREYMLRVSYLEIYNEVLD